MRKKKYWILRTTTTTLNNIFNPIKLMKTSAVKIPLFEILVLFSVISIFYSHIWKMQPTYTHTQSILERVTENERAKSKSHKSVLDLGYEFCHSSDSKLIFLKCFSSFSHLFHVCCSGKRKRFDGLLFFEDWKIWMRCLNEMTWPCRTIFQMFLLFFKSFTSNCVFWFPFPRNHFLHAIKLKQYLEQLLHIYPSETLRQKSIYFISKWRTKNNFSVSKTTIEASNCRRIFFVVSQNRAPPFCRIIHIFDQTSINKKIMMKHQKYCVKNGEWVCKLMK